MLAVDSIQTVVDAERPGAPGSVTQVRDCAYRLVQLAKARGMATVLVGHVTKEGTLAGPRVLEHVVDTVLAFEGDRGHSLRLLRALKHRYGSTQELGLFDMAADGLAGVPDASARFLVDRRPGVAGSAIAAVVEGDRPVMVEVQALVVDGEFPSPRRSGSGIDAQRLALLLAVLAQRAGVNLMRADVYASVAGGLRVTEPGVDLALALAAAERGHESAAARRSGGGGGARPRRRGALGAATRAAAGGGRASRLHCRARAAGHGRAAGHRRARGVRPARRRRPGTRRSAGVRGGRGPGRGILSLSAVVRPTERLSAPCPPQSDRNP